MSSPREPLDPNRERIVSAVPLDDDSPPEREDPAPGLRGFIGQPDCVARLRSFLDLYRRTGSTPGHILILGEDGMGKRTLARAAAGRDVTVQEIDGSALQIKGDLSAIFTNLRPDQILVFKGVSALKRDIHRVLLEAATSNKLEFLIGQGPSARRVSCELPAFTLICTCAKESECSPELQQCFALKLTMQSYSNEALSELAGVISAKQGLEMSADAQTLLALHCGGRPRQLEVLVMRVARAVSKTHIEDVDVRRAFEAFGINLKAATIDDAEALPRMKGTDFERLITKLLIQMDFRAEMTRATGDGGIDIVAVLDKPIIGGKYLFQCKCYRADSVIGAATVREFYGAVSAERAVKGIFITTSDFTSQAREFAEKVGIDLINLATLRRLLNRYEMGDVPQLKKSNRAETLF